METNQKQNLRHNKHLEPRIFDFSVQLEDPKTQFLFVLLIAITFIFAKSGQNALPNYDDCYYAQKAKEILQYKDWFTMHYDGKPSFDNPPFYMWLSSISFFVFGINDFAARFPSQLMGVLTVLLVYLLARRLFQDNSISFFSSIILTTTYIFIRYARHSMVDTTLSFFTCLAIYSLVLAFNKSKYFLLWGVSIAACILTKSVLGFFPLIISVIYIVSTQNWQILRSKYFYLGILISLLIGCFWYFHQYLYYGDEFIKIHFDWLIFQRGLQNTSNNPLKQLIYFRDLFFFYWPWLPFLVYGFICVKKEKKLVLPIIWFLIIFFCMSYMKTSSKWYVLSAYPAAALISAYGFNQLLIHFNCRLLVSKIGSFIILVLLALFCFIPFKLESDKDVDLRAMLSTVKIHTESKLISYKINFFDMNNLILYYSDRSIVETYNSLPELMKVFAKPQTILCFVKTSDLNELRNQMKVVFVVQTNTKYSLITNYPLKEL